MKLVWHPNAWTEYVNWQTGDRKILKRINTLIKDIQRGEDGGIGKPELLKGDLSGWASRRINEEHRLVYRVVDAHDQLEILSCRHHYADRLQQVDRHQPTESRFVSVGGHACPKPMKQRLMGSGSTIGSWFTVGGPRISPSGWLVLGTAEILRAWAGHPEFRLVK